MNVSQEPLAKIMRMGCVIAVVTIERAEDASPIAAALSAGGIRVLEVTLRSAAALPAIETIAANHADVIVGAGTARCAQDFRDASNAGAQFIVSPGFTAAMADSAAAVGRPWLAGVATASEVLQAQEAGLSRLKFFPAEPGGVETLRAFAAVFPDVRFCPTGGITLDRAARWLALPNVDCVGGSWLTPGAAVDSQDWDKIKGLAAAAAKLERPGAAEAGAADR
jgi:2-dehydro-3-deoxyphosphogluconate aldolase/(4S)-4-hydroxy-2-oxoglutarate aldolase